MNNMEWILCKDRLPEIKGDKLDYFRNLYLTCDNYGLIQVIQWCDGWNCSYDCEKQEVTRDYEMKNIIGWLELPERIRDYGETEEV